MKRNAMWSMVVILGAVTTAQAAYVGSLENDFSLASNSNSDTWSYRLSYWAEAIPTRFSYLLPTNTRSATDVWGAPFASPPTMWSDAVGFWGIGKNSSGVDQTAGALTWPNGTVLLHPDPNGSGNLVDGDPLRFVISWQAPSAMIIDASWSFSMAPGLVPAPGPDGNGVAIAVDSYLGGTPSEGPWSALTSLGPVNGSITGLSVAAGDRLYWTIENWGDPTGDITMASINIVEIPEPSSLILFGLGAAAMFGRIKARRTKRAGH